MSRKHLACLWVLVLTAAMGLAASAAEVQPAEQPAAPSAAKPEGATPSAPAANPATKWEPQIQAYEKQDKESPPPTGAVLFVGSSTIRMWKTLEDDFKPMKVIGRGVGGCGIPDMVYYADRIVVPYKPRQVVFYAGDNDLAGKKTAGQALADFKAFAEKVRKALPEVKIHFVSIKPSPSRAKVWDEAQKANQMIRGYCQATPGLAFLDITQAMLGADGQPKPEIFLKDMLHMNRAGYELWIPLIKAALEKGAAPASEEKR